MKYSNMVKRSFGIMFHSFSLWVVALILLAIQMVILQVLIPTDLAVLIISLVVPFLVNIVLSGALIAMVNDLAEGKGASIGGGFAAAVAYTPKLICLALLLALPTWIVMFLLTGSFTSALWSALNLSSTEFSAPYILQILSRSLALNAIVSLVIGLLLSAITVGGQRALVLEQTGVIAALIRGWSLLTRHIVNFIVLVLITLVLSFVVLFLLGIAVSALNYSVTILSSVVGAVIFSSLTIFGSIVWTLAFRFWQGKDAAAVVPSPAPPVSPSENFPPAS